MTEPFKVCTNCNTTWQSRERFLADPAIELVGYQVSFKNLKLGFFLFNHSCKSTIAIHAGEFTDLYDGPVFEERHVGDDLCPGQCLHQSNLRRCPVHCECAYVREVLHIVQEWPKETVA
jgi:hypothetical protein